MDMPLSLLKNYYHITYFLIENNLFKGILTEKSYIKFDVSLVNTAVSWQIDRRSTKFFFHRKLEIELLIKVMLYFLRRTPHIFCWRLPKSLALPPIFMTRYIKFQKIKSFEAFLLTSFLESRWSPIKKSLKPGRMSGNKGLITGLWNPEDNILWSDWIISYQSQPKNGLALAAWYADWLSNTY